MEKRKKIEKMKKFGFTRKILERKVATACSLEEWGWRELKVLPVAWFDELARILTKVEDVGVWPDGLLDAHIAMIPKIDGDATPQGQRPLSVLLVVYRLRCQEA